MAAARHEGGIQGCVPELICPAWDVFKNPDKHTLKEAQDWSNRIYPISQAIYGGGQPSGEAHARLKEALKQRGIFFQRSDAQARSAPEPGGEGLGRSGSGAQPAPRSGYGAVQVR